MTPGSADPVGIPSTSVSERLRDDGPFKRPADRGLSPVPHRSVARPGAALCPTRAKTSAASHGVIACSDARIDPQTIFDAAPGDLFVIRNVAGLVPPYAPDGGCHGTSAALEYAVKILKVRRIVVLGHAKCDGVHALIHGPLRNARDFLDPWMDIAEPVMWPMPEPNSGEALEMAVEDAVLALSLSNLRTFPWIRDGETAGHLALTAWRFDISTGELRTT